MQELAAERGEDALETNPVQESSRHESSKSHCGSDFLHIPLPFLQRDGMVSSMHLTIDKQLPPAIETAPNHNHGSVIRPQSCARKKQQIQNDMVRDGPHLEHFSVTDTLGGICHDCGCESQDFCSEQSLFNEAGLMHCEEELRALHCAEALYTDLNCSSYPICNSVVPSNFNTVETETCNGKRTNSCASRSFGSLSFGILRLVSSLLAPDFEAWLADKVAGNGERRQHVEDILASTEQFLQNRATLLQLQRSTFKAQAAQKQAGEDYKAILQSRSSKPVEGCLLKQFFADRVQERTQKFMSVAQPFLALLNQINLLLEFCYAEACTASVCQFPAFLCTATPEQAMKAVDKVERDKFSEVVQTAVSSWLLVYHDVAHATGLI